MFEKGEKVVCVNDKVNPGIRSLYHDWIIKGAVYTIRYCDLGTASTEVKPAGRGWEKVSYKVLVSELRNDKDPRVGNPDDPISDHNEMGFSSDRFAPMQELTKSHYANKDIKEPELV